MSELPQGELARRRRSHSSSDESETTRLRFPERATRAGQKAADAAVHQAQLVRERAQKSFAQQRDRAASTIEHMSRAFDFVSDEVRPQDESAAEYLEQAGERMRQAAAYVSTATPASLRNDVTTFARQHPSLALGGSFFVGIVIGRFFHASTPSVGPAPHGEERVAEPEPRPGNGGRPMAMEKPHKKFIEHS